MSKWTAYNFDFDIQVDFMSIHLCAFWKNLLNKIYSTLYSGKNGKRTKKTLNAMDEKLVLFFFQVIWNVYFDTSMLTCKYVFTHGSKHVYFYEFKFNCSNRLISSLIWGRIGDRLGDTGAGRNLYGVDVLITKVLAVHSMRMVIVEFSQGGIVTGGLAVSKIDHIKDVAHSI